MPPAGWLCWTAQILTFSGALTSFPNFSTGTISASTARTNKVSEAIPHLKATEMPNTIGTHIDETLPSTSDKHRSSAPETHPDSDMERLYTSAQSRDIADNRGDHQCIDNWRTVDTPGQNQSCVYSDSGNNRIMIRAQPASHLLGRLNSHRKGYAELKMHSDSEEQT